MNHYKLLDALGAVIGKCDAINEDEAWEAFLQDPCLTNTKAQLIRRGFTLSVTKMMPEYHATGAEQVTVRTEAMESLPVGANPFRHVDWSMGTPLVRDWTVMHEGFDSPENQKALNWLYLYNARSGQRIKIYLDHAVPEGFTAPSASFGDQLFGVSMTNCLAFR